MSATLYLFRKDPALVSSSLFRASDTDMDIIFIEQASSKIPSSVKETVVATRETSVRFSHPPMTYDDLIEKIFSSEHIIIV